MTPDEFYRQLEGLGFTDSGVRSAEAPEARSYDPPERLATTLTSVNIGRLGSPTKHAVTLQVAEGCDIPMTQGERMPEIGSALGPIAFPMDKALLEALALDASQLLQWIDHYPIFSFSLESVDEPGKEITGVCTRRGFEVAEDVN